MRTFVITLLATLGLVAPAAASDPLLSGYSGPGGGDQAILGTDLVGPPPAGGSLRSSGAAPSGLAAATVTAPALSATPVAGGASGPKPRANGTSGADAASGGSGTGSPKSSSNAGASPPSTAGPATRQVAYPTTSSDEGAFPLAGEDLLLLLLGMAALGAIAVATARTSSAPVRGA